MKNGDWLEFERRNENGTEEGWDFLEREVFEIDGKRMTKADFLHGCCDLFAVALNRRFGYPILYVRDETGESRFAHAFCVDEDGNFVDVRGRNSDFDEFFENFEDFADPSEFSEFVREATKDEEVSIVRRYGIEDPRLLEIAKKVVDAYAETYGRRKAS